MKNTQIMANSISRGIELCKSDCTFLEKKTIHPKANRIRKSSQNLYACIYQPFVFTNPLSIKLGKWVKKKPPDLKSGGFG